MIWVYGAGVHQREPAVFTEPERDLLRQCAESLRGWTSRRNPLSKQSLRFVSEGLLGLGLADDDDARSLAQQLAPTELGQAIKGAHVWHGNGTRARTSAPLASALAHVLARAGIKCKLDVRLEESHGVYHADVLLDDAGDGGKKTVLLVDGWCHVERIVGSPAWHGSTLNAAGRLRRSLLERMGFYVVSIALPDWKAALGSKNWVRHELIDRAPHLADQLAPTTARDAQPGSGQRNTSK